MKRSLSTIPGLMVIVGFAALGAYALRTGSLETFKITYCSTVLVLTLATVAAWAQRHGAGGFWGGFAVFGWVYFLFALQWPEPAPGSDRPPVVNASLVLRDRVREAAQQIDSAMKPAEKAPVDISELYLFREGQIPMTVHHRTLVLHCLLAVWLGVIGGAIGMGLASRHRPAQGAATR